jgi:hypothetical protein
MWRSLCSKLEDLRKTNRVQFLMFKTKHCSLVVNYLMDAQLKDLTEELGVQLKWIQ